MSDDLLVARESFVTSLDGQDQVIQAGHTIVRQGHPILRGREAMFGPLTVHFDTEKPREEPGKKRS